MKFSRASTLLGFAFACCACLEVAAAELPNPLFADKAPSAVFEISIQQSNGTLCPAIDEAPFNACRSGQEMRFAYSFEIRSKTKLKFHTCAGPKVSLTISDLNGVLVWTSVSRDSSYASACQDADIGSITPRSGDFIWDQTDLKGRPANPGEFRATISIHGCIEAIGCEPSAAAVFVLRAN